MSQMQNRTITKNIFQKQIRYYNGICWCFNSCITKKWGLEYKYSMLIRSKHTSIGYAYTYIYIYRSKFRFFKLYSNHD